MKKAIIIIVALAVLGYLLIPSEKDKNNEDIRFLAMAELMIEKEAMKGYSGYRYDTHFSTKISELANELEYSLDVYYWALNLRADKQERVSEQFQVLVTKNEKERNDVKLYRIYDDIKE